MRPSQQARQMQGVILHVRDLTNASRIIDVLTDDVGRIALLVRGARASKRRFAGVLDVFMSVQLCAVPPLNHSDLWTLQSADSVKQRIGIRANWNSFARASVLCDCARAVAAPSQPAPDMFKALVDSLDLLDAGEGLRAVQGYPSLLLAAGLMPDLSVCADCGENAVLMSTFARAAIGILCLRCSPPTAITHEHRAIRDVFMGQTCRDESLARACEGMAISWFEHHVGRALRSRALLNPSVA